MRIAALSVAILALVACATAQETDNSCPTLSVTGPSSVVKPGEIATYRVTVDKRGLNITPVYKWSVSAGTIVSGQGTEKIDVRSPATWNTTATVEVQGFPLGCPNIASETASEGPGFMPVATKIAEFTGPVGKANLSGILEALKREPNSQLFILVSGTKRYRDRSVRNKRDAIAKQLLTFRDGPLASARITWVESTKTDDKTVFWLVPPGATPPTP